MDLGFLADTYRVEGPYATVYLQPRRPGEDAATQVELRWSSLRQRLRGDGADQATVAAVEQVLLPQRPGVVETHGRTVVAAGGTVLLDRPLGTPSRPGLPELAGDEARWAPLPHLLPMLAYERQPPPHLLVVANRLGADIHVLADGPELLTTVDGEEFPLHKVQAGGWSHRRYQQRAENLWEHNAGLVATTVSKLATRHRAKLILLAGDVRARTAICDRLPPAVREVTTETEHGSRAPGAAQAPLREEAAGIAAEQARRAHEQVLDRFATERHDPQRSAEGLERVIDAVRQSAVDTLLLDAATHLDPGRPRPEVWVGPRGTDLALTKIELEKAGVEEYAADRPDAALVRGAVATGARLELLGEGDPAVTDGMAAVLRHPLVP